MKIIQDFPFTHCESCPECFIDVNEQVLFADNGFLERNLVVRCKNDALCIRLEEVRNAERDRTDTDER